MALVVKEDGVDKPITAVTLRNPTGIGSPDIAVSSINATLTGGETPEWVNVWSSEISLFKYAFAVSTKSTLHYHSGSSVQRGTYVILIPHDEMRFNGSTADASSPITGMTINGNSFTANSIFLEGEVDGVLESPLAVKITRPSLFRGSAIDSLFDFIDLETALRQIGKTEAELFSHLPARCLIAFAQQVYDDTTNSYDENPAISADMDNLTVSIDFTGTLVTVDDGGTFVTPAPVEGRSIANYTSVPWTPDDMPGIAGWGFANDLNYRASSEAYASGGQTPYASENFRRWKLWPHLNHGDPIPSSYADLVMFSGISSPDDQLIASGVGAQYAKRGYPGVAWPSPPVAAIGGGYAIKRSSDQVFYTTSPEWKYSSHMNQPSAFKGDGQKGLWFVHGNYAPAGGETPSLVHGAGWHSYDATVPANSLARIHAKQVNKTPGSNYELQVHRIGAARNAQLPASNPTVSSPTPPQANVIGMYIDKTNAWGYGGKIYRHGGTMEDLTTNEYVWGEEAVNFRINGAITFASAAGHAMLSNERDITFSPTDPKTTLTGFIAFGKQMSVDDIENTVMADMTEGLLRRCVNFAAKKAPLCLDILVGGDKHSVYVIFNQLLSTLPGGSWNEAFEKGFSKAEPNGVPTFFTGVSVSTLADNYTVVRLSSLEEITEVTEVSFIPQVCNIVNSTGVKPTAIHRRRVHLPTLPVVDGLGTGVTINSYNLYTIFAAKWPMLTALPILVKFTLVTNLSGQNRPTYSTIRTGSGWVTGSLIRLSKPGVTLAGGNSTPGSSDEYMPALEATTYIEIDNSDGAINGGLINGTGNYQQWATGIEYISFIGTNNGSINGRTLETYLVTIPQNASNVNLRNLFIDKYPDITGSVSVGFMQAGTILSTDATIPTLTTGNWPAGSSIALYKAHMSAEGKGGKGAGWNSDIFSGSATYNAEDGGDCIEVLYPIAIDNYGGFISSGGGGGGRATTSVYSAPTAYDPGMTIYYGFCGGGGAGIEGGVSGTGSYSYRVIDGSSLQEILGRENFNGTTGNYIFGGLGGGDDAISTTIKGGKGGDWGANGTGTGAGVSGKSITGYSQVTWIRTGSLIGPTEA